MENTRLSEFMSLVNDRYSCRDFDSEKPVSRQTLESIIETARLAPSACNRQPWIFIVVTKKEQRTEILSKSRPSFMNAPAIIVCCGNHSEAWHRPSDGKDHTDVDVSIAVEHICLAASARGLGTCWVCSFDVDATRKAVSLPEDYEAIALIPIGYPTSDNIPEKKRKPLSDILRWESF